MMRGREEEADADFVDTAGDLLWTKIDLDSSDLEQIGAPATAGDRAVAMLGHTPARRGDHEGARRRNIERAQTVAAGTAGIHEFVPRDAHARGQLAHDFRRRS